MPPRALMEPEIGSSLSHLSSSLPSIGTAALLLEGLLHAGDLPQRGLQNPARNGRLGEGRGEIGGEPVQPVAGVLDVPDGERTVPAACAAGRF